MSTWTRMMDKTNMVERPCRTSIVPKNVSSHTVIAVEWEEGYGRKNRRLLA